jgi:hypothetical protein
MPVKRNAFPYRSAKKVNGWGSQFDSLTELKFAISIMEEYYFLRSPVAIYYHPGTKITLDHLRRCHLRYTPDFLIRHKETFEATLIEIKPRAFEDHPQLFLRKAVAENYILRKNLDWKFKVVFDDQIILIKDQIEAFTECTSFSTGKAMAAWYSAYSLRMNQTFPDNILSDLVISGPKRPTHSWKQLRLL